MAKVNITIRDKRDGSVGVSVEFIPALEPQSNEPATPAQNLAFEVIQHLRNLED